MNALKADFADRCAEVDRFFVFLEQLDSPGASLQRMVGTDFETKPIDVELLKSLKASSFLLLYNLVEWTVSHAIEAIFDAIKSQGVPFDDVTDQLKKIIITNARALGPGDLASRLNRVAHDLIHETFDRATLFSGNLDARQVRETFKKFGIKSPVGTGGEVLVTVKGQRNGLAHGSISFAECGRAYSVEQLRLTERKTVAYLKAVLNSVESFVSQREFIHPRLATAI